MSNNQIEIVYSTVNIKHVKIAFDLRFGPKSRSLIFFSTAQCVYGSILSHS